MPLVELVGPPTVGKTTVVAACVRAGATDARRAVLAPRAPMLAGMVPAARAVASTDAGLRRWLLDRALVAPGAARTEQALLAVSEAWKSFLTLVLEAPHAGGARPGEQRSAEQLALALVERQWLDAAIGLRALLEPVRGSGSVLLLDEGLTHPFKAHAAVGDAPNDVDRYADAVPLPDVLVVLEADERVLLERFRARLRRDGERVRRAVFGPDLDDKAIAEQLRRAVVTVDRIATAAERRGCPTIRLRVGDTTPESLAGELRRRLATQSSASSPEVGR
jgi:hypothetical protein